MSKPDMQATLWAMRDSWPRIMLEVQFGQFQKVPPIGDVWSLTVDDGGGLLTAYRATLGEIGGIRQFRAPEGWVWALVPRKGGYTARAIRPEQLTDFGDVQQTPEGS